MEIGIDIENSERFKTITPHFIERTYTKNEIEYANKKKNSYETFCAIWCVKEAIIKAFSNLKIPFLEIEVLHDKEGKPYISKNETILKELKKVNCFEIKISISHTSEYSTAVCLIY